MKTTLTRRQEQIYAYLRDHASRFPHPPTLDEVCQGLGLRSRGSLHKHIQALVEAGLVEAPDGKKRGLRLADPAGSRLPFLGHIAAGRPIEAVENAEVVEIPEDLRTGKECYVLGVRGDSMIEAGILDGDRVVVESRGHARNGEIVVALIDGWEATLKRIEQRPGEVVLHPANAAMEPMVFSPERVAIQGVVVGLMRAY